MIPRAFKHNAAIRCSNSHRFWWVSSILLLLIFSTGELIAQRNLTLFNMGAVPQSYVLNPGQMPLSNVYVSVPLVGNINADYSNSSFSFGDLMLNSSNGDFFDNNFDKFLSILSNENKLFSDVSANWLGFGFRVKRNFFSFQVGDYVQFQANYPKSLFVLLDDVSHSSSTFVNGKDYILNTLSINGTHFRSYGVGYTRAITSRLSFGARFKLLSGLANISTFNQGLGIYNHPERNYLVIRGRMDVYSSGLQTLQNDPSAYIWGTGNRGFAFDFGANYQVNKQIEVFGSLIDWGKIAWKNDLTQNSFVANNVELSNKDLDQFQDELGNFIDSLQSESSKPITSYSTRLPAMAYFGGNYYFRPNTSVGVLLNPRFFLNQTDWAFAVSLQHRIKKILQATITYSTYNKSTFNLGAGLAVNAGPLQVYLVSDNFLPIFNLDNAKNVQFNAGINLAFGRMTREEQMQLWQDSTSTNANDIAVVEKPIERVPTSTKENKTKPQKPAKTEPAPKEEITAPVEAPKPVVETSGSYFVLTGTAHAINGDLLPGVSVEVFQKHADGTEELTFISGYLDGNIRVYLKRDQTYRVVVKKPGYTDREIMVTPTEMQDQNTMEQSVTLSVAPVEPIIEKPKTTPQPESNFNNKNDKPNESAGTFKVKNATSLRAEASSSARSLFRFAPGNQVNLLEKTNKDWWKVRYLERTGYIKAAVLENVE